MKTQLTHGSSDGDDGYSYPNDSTGGYGYGYGYGDGYGDGYGLGFGSGDGDGYGDGYGDGGGFGSGDGDGFGDGSSDDDHLPLDMICTMVDGLAEQMINVLCASLITR